MTDPTKHHKVGTSRFAIICAIALTMASLINALFGTKTLIALAFDARPPLEQVFVGILSGLAIALAIAILMMISLRRAAVLAVFQNQLAFLAARIDFSGLAPLWMALLAGLGEEVLFRGALQPIIGIWWSSLVFVILHSGTYQFRSMNLTKAGIAVIILIVSVTMGHIFLNFGLLAAITAHATIDIVALFALQWQVLRYAEDM